MSQQGQGTQKVIVGEEYCAARVRGQIKFLLWAILALFIAVCCGTLFFFQLFADKTYWEMEDYVTLVVVGGITIGAAALGVYMAYVGIRDTFFPENSILAKSIRSQLPFPEGAPSVKELFATVDKDIQENGIWFDTVAVGREWVLGDAAAYIPNIRAVFGRDVIRHNRNTHTRIIELYILDHRKQAQVSSLKNPKELQPLLDCLKLRAPDALFLPYGQYVNYLNKSESEWNTLELEYRNRKAQRESKEVQKDTGKVEQNMILMLPDGNITSRVSAELIRETLKKAVHQAEAVFRLTPGRPVMANGISYSYLECAVFGFEEEEAEEGWYEEDFQSEAEIYLMIALTPSEMGQQPKEGREIQCDFQQAEDILLAFLQGQVPKTGDWLPMDLYSTSEFQQPSSSHPGVLTLVSSSGVRQSHNTFTREDVEVGADGIVDGDYQQVALTLPGGYLWFQVKTGDKMDGRCTVIATRADEDKLRFFTTRCTHRQAAAWLLEYYDGKFRPQGPDWKDCTKKMTRD